MLGGYSTEVKVPLVVRIAQNYISWSLAGTRLQCGARGSSSARDPCGV